MKKSWIKKVVATLFFITSFEAMALCEVEDILKDKIELQLSYNKEYKYESAVIKHYNATDFGTIKGEIVPDRASWTIKNTEGVTVGSITYDDLTIIGMDDDCEKLKLKLKKSKGENYQIVKNGALIGEIKGKLPKEY